MAFNLASISSAKRVRAPRIVILGTSGIGKSEFASGSDNPIFIPVKGEEGIDGIDVPAFPPVETVDQLMEAVGSLYSENHEYKTAVFDSTSALGPIFDQAALDFEKVKDKANLGGGWGHQWDTIIRLWRDFLAGLDALRNDRNMTIVLIGHVKIKPSREPGQESFDTWAWDIDGKVGDMLIRWADGCFFMNRKIAVQKEDGGFGKKEKKGISIMGGQRFLFTQAGATYPAKTRDFFKNLPAEIPLPRKNAWTAFMDAVIKTAE